MDDGLKLHKVEVRATVWVMATDQEDAKGITMDWLNEDAIPLGLTACLALANQQGKIKEAIQDEVRRVSEEDEVLKSALLDAENDVDTDYFDDYQE